MIGYLAILDTPFPSIKVKHASGAFSGCRHIARTAEMPGKGLIFFLRFDAITQILL